MACTNEYTPTSRIHVVEATAAIIAVNAIDTAVATASVAAATTASAADTCAKQPESRRFAGGQQEVSSG